MTSRDFKFRYRQMTVRENRKYSRKQDQVQSLRSKTSKWPLCKQIYCRASSFCRLRSGSEIIYEAAKATALTVPVGGAGSWPWHRPTPQRGAVGFQSSSYLGSHRGTGSDREPVETAAHSLSPGLTQLSSGWKDEIRAGSEISDRVYDYQ